MRPQLASNDPHFWAPDQSLIEALCADIPVGANVLEIGPGHIPFPRANVFVDIKDFGKVKSIRRDLAEENLPFPDKEFDFVYARHVLEDMWNPFRLCREMSRVAKAGFIETPSPLAEFCRGVDGGAPPWRGYHHHYFLIWPHNGVLNFMGKFPLVEYIGIPEPQEAQYLKMLASGAHMWNTRLHWTDEVKFKHVQCPQDFALPADYPGMVSKAITEWQQDLIAQGRK